MNIIINFMKFLSTVASFIIMRILTCTTGIDNRWLFTLNGHHSHWLSVIFRRHIHKVFALLGYLLRLRVKADWRIRWRLCPWKFSGGPDSRSRWMKGPRDALRRFKLILTLWFDGCKVIFAESYAFFDEKVIHIFILIYYWYKIIEPIYCKGRSTSNCLWRKIIMQSFGFYSSCINPIFSIGTYGFVRRFLCVSQLLSRPLFSV